MKQQVDWTQVTAVCRGSLLWFEDNPYLVDVNTSMKWIEDGLLVLRGGLIEAVLEAGDYLNEIPEGVDYQDYSGKLILPGLIDAHCHYPQTLIMASYGDQLLDWLNHYTFPEEARFADTDYAKDIARLFINQLIRNGTTTASVYCTVHESSAQALFEEAAAQNMRISAGNVLMDRHAPDNLCLDAQASIDLSERLIDQWHHHQRLSYCLTPRFAPTSSDELLTQVSELLRNQPSIRVQTHIAENPEEVAWVRTLFPWAKDYLAVYEHYGLLRPHCLLGHGIYLSASERNRIAQAQASITFCPTSNLFLGSGLLSLREGWDAGIEMSIASDVGAGTGFSMLQTLAEAYKVGQLQKQPLSAAQGLYLATLGNARAMGIADKVGSFEVGKEADFILIDEEANPLLARKKVVAGSLEERLFSVMMLGDDRLVDAVWVAGQAINQ